MSCAFHAHEGDAPCPWCSEAAGAVVGHDDGAWRSAPHCARCESRDRRRNEIAGYSWCGACGVRQ